MRTPPTVMIRVLAPFAPLFSQRIFQHVQVLLAGAILAPGRRTVSSALRAMGLDQQKQFHRYHRVLSHARWSSREASRLLLGLLDYCPFSAARQPPPAQVLSSCRRETSPADGVVAGYLLESS